ATSYEFGGDIKLFRDRVRFSGTYYRIENENQILSNPLAPSSGYSRLNYNAGLLVSRGVELELGGTPFDRNGLRWDISANYSYNRTKIEELAPGLDRFTLWTDAKGGAWTYVGEEIGDIYDAELVTVKDPNSPYYGYPILDENGSWQAVG